MRKRGEVDLSRSVSCGDVLHETHANRSGAEFQTRGIIVSTSLYTHTLIWFTLIRLAIKLKEKSVSLTRDDTPQPQHSPTQQKNNNVIWKQRDQYVNYIV